MQAVLPSSKRAKPFVLRIDFDSMGRTVLEGR
jgi:hypothetical protein